MAGRTAEALVSLGTDVADKMLTQGADMTMSVGALRNSLDLSDEEVRRVCENANRAAFANYYYNSSGEERNPQFELANPEDILGDSVEKTAQFLQGSMYAPGFTTPRTDDFRSRKVRMVDAGWEEKSAAAVTPLDLNAPVGPAWESAYREMDHAREVQTIAEYNYFGAIEDLRKEAAEVLRGTPVEHFAEAIIQASYGREEAAAEVAAQLRPVVNDMRERSLLKHAAWRKSPPMVDLEHPVIQKFIKAASLVQGVADTKIQFVKAAAKEKLLRQMLNEERLARMS